MEDTTMIEAIELKTNPEIKRIVTAAFPGYKKQKAYMSEFLEMNINSYWDGGSRDEYAIVELATMRRAAMPTSTHPYFDVARYGIKGENNVLPVDARGNITLKRLPQGFVLVQAGTFCGKQAAAHVYTAPKPVPADGTVEAELIPAGVL